MRNIPFSLLLFIVSALPFAPARAQPFAYPVDVCDLTPAGTDDRADPLRDASYDPALAPGCAATAPYPGQAYPAAGQAYPAAGQAYPAAGHAAHVYSGPAYRTTYPMPYYPPLYPQAAYPAAVYPPVGYPTISYPLPGFSGRVYVVPRYQPQPRHHHPMPIIVVPRHSGHGHHEHRHSRYSRHGRY